MCVGDGEGSELVELERRPGEDGGVGQRVGDGRAANWPNWSGVRVETAASDSGWVRGGQRIGRTGVASGWRRRRRTAGELGRTDVYVGLQLAPFYVAQLWHGLAQLWHGLARDGERQQHTCQYIALCLSYQTCL